MKSNANKIWESHDIIEGQNEIVYRENIIAKRIQNQTLRDSTDRLLRYFAKSSSYRCWCCNVTWH